MDLFRLVGLVNPSVGNWPAGRLDFQPRKRLCGAAVPTYTSVALAAVEIPSEGCCVGDADVCVG